LILSLRGRGLRDAGGSDGRRDILDEIFVVISGSATVEFADDSPTLNIGPGDVVRLAEGADTVWTVTETLRKVYLA
jgi:uncharacterized cupin superfamily protein